MPHFEVIGIYRKNVNEVVVNTLKECKSLFSGNDKPQTCLIMAEAINTSPENLEHIEALKNSRNDYKSAWKSWLEKAILDIQTIKETNSIKLADYFTTIIQGMALMAKYRANRDNLVKTSEIAIQILKQFVDKKTVSKNPTVYS